MMNFRSAAGGSGGGPVLKGSGGSSSSNNPCLEQHNINIAAATTTTTAQGFMQITNNIYEGLIDQDSFISSPSLASTAAACINSGSCNTRASTGNDLLYYLSVVKEKVQQLQALVATAISNHTHHHQNHEKEHPTAAAAATSAASLIHEIIFAASSMAYAFQQLSPVSPPGHLQCKSSEIDHHQQNHYKKQAAPSYAINRDHHDTSQLATTDDNTCIHQHQLSAFGRNSSEAAAAAAGGGQYYNIFAAAAGSVNETQCQYNTINTTDVATAKKISDATTTSSGAMAAMELVGNINDTDHKEAADHAIIELEAADLLAKYTHFCQVCGKGFRREANLRMHMRAHGDEYKTNEALTNPMKRQKLMMKMKNNKSSTSTSSTNDELMLEEDPHEEEFTAAAGIVVPQNRNQKYSCPHEGCRWNKKHAKFQPLKSMVCVKNHYKRSHCPKMYVCNRCNRKQFSVLSDLRTHEKHCGDNLRWRCSCGTTFSRKDKLMSHVALFVGHAPAIAPLHNNTRSISAPLPTD